MNASRHRILGLKATSNWLQTGCKLELHFEFISTLKKISDVLPSLVVRLFATSNFLTDNINKLYLNQVKNKLINCYHISSTPEHTQHLIFFSFYCYILRNLQ